MNCWLLAAFFLVLLWFVLHFVPLCPITKHGVWPTLSTTPSLFFLISCHCFNFQNSKLSGRKKIHSILLGYIQFPTNFSDFLTILTNWLFAFFPWVQNPDSRSFKISLWISFKNQFKTHFVFFSQSFFQSLENTQKGQIWRLLQRLANLKGHWRGFALRAAFAPYAMRYYLDDRERCGGYTEVASWFYKIQKVHIRWIMKLPIRIPMYFWFSEKSTIFGKLPQKGAKNHILSKNS